MLSLVCEGWTMMMGMMKPLQMSIIHDNCPVHAQILTIVGMRVSTNSPFLTSQGFHNTLYLTF